MGHFVVGPEHFERHFVIRRAGLKNASTSRALSDSTALIRAKTNSFENHVTDKNDCRGDALPACER